jgi:hypothetical protein
MHMPVVDVTLLLYAKILLASPLHRAWLKEACIGAALEIFKFFFLQQHK